MSAQSQKQLQEWEELDTRLQEGRELTMQEQARHALLSQNLPSVKLELQAYSSLKGWLEHGSDSSRARLLGDSVLERRGVHVEPQLRLVSDEQKCSPVEEPLLFRSRLRSRARAGMFVGAGLAVAAGIAALVLPSKGPGSVAPVVQRTAAEPARIELVMVSGAVTVDGQVASMTASLVKQGAVVKTQAGTACLTIDPEVEMCLGPQSEAVLSSVSWPEVSVQVNKGVVAAQLSTRGAGERFSLTGVGLRATAKGTVFALEVNPAAEQAAVTVLEGSVDVTGASHTVSVPAHTMVQRIVTGFKRSAELKRRTVSRGEEGALWGLLVGDEWRNTKNVGILSVSLPQTDESTPHRALSARIDDSAALVLPLSVLLPAGPHRLSVDGSETAFEIIAGEQHEIVVDPRAQERAARKTPARERTAAEQLQYARGLLKAGKRRAALAAYRHLVLRHPKSKEAATVSVTVAQLELQVGEPGRALKTFNRYLASGAGALAPEALAGKIEALRRLGRNTQADKASREYLRKYPKGIHAPALRERLH